MKIDDKIDYEFIIPISENESETAIYDGKMVNLIVLWYHNTIANNNTGYIKLKGGAMINDEYFDKMIKK